MRDSDRLRVVLVAVGVLREWRPSSIPSTLVPVDNSTLAAASTRSGEWTEPGRVMQGRQSHWARDVAAWLSWPVRPPAAKRPQVLLHSRPHTPSGSGRWSVAAMYNLPVTPLGRSEWRQPSPSVT